MNTREFLGEGLLPSKEIARIQETLYRWSKCESKIDKFRDALAKGQIEKVETLDRINNFIHRTYRGRAVRMSEGMKTKSAAKKGKGRPFKNKQLVEFVKERMLGPENDIRSIEFFERGLLAARSVGRIDRLGTPLGTGFIIGPKLVMTNNHVLGTEEDAELANLVMDAEDNTIGMPKAAETYALIPERFFITDKDLDFTIVGIDSPSEAGVDIDVFGFIPLDGREGKALIGQHTNIVQHPGGSNKKVVFRNSRLIYLDNSEKPDIYLFYEADTQKGSSGSPVFNDRWELIGLHHSSVPKTNDSGEVLDKRDNVISEQVAKANPQRIAWAANEGVRVSRIVKAVKAAKLKGNKRNLRDAMVKLWDGPATGKNDLLGLESRRGAGRQRSIALGRSELPINITIRVE